MTELFLKKTKDLLNKKKLNYAESDNKEKSYYSKKNKQKIAIEFSK